MSSFTRISFTIVYILSFGDVTCWIMYCQASKVFITLLQVKQVLTVVSDLLLYLLEENDG